ncbi:MAG TPA: hypothetical protein P5121_27710 [Caldilineaceae bacterium]|nr:hypothetical protein [Caldilineaceae bacterium]
MAALLQQAKLGTLLLDLVTPREVDIDYATRRLRFDIDLLSQRIVQATDCLLQQQSVQNLPIGYFFEEPGKLEEVANLARDWFFAHCERELAYGD